MESTRTMFYRIWHNSNYRSALIVFVVLLIWLLSGVLATSSEAPKADEPGAVQGAVEQTVQVRQLMAVDYPVTVAVRGRSEANRSVVVRVETAGRVVAVPGREGLPIDEGEPLCELAMDDRELRLMEAKAKEEAATLDYDGALKLESSGYQSQKAIAAAKAVLETARAEMLARQLDVKRTIVRAPFAGVVHRRPAEIGDYLREGEECATVLETDPLIIVGRVSELDVTRIALGDDVAIRFVNGEQTTGKVSLIEPQADATLRTFAVEVSVDNPALLLRGGMSATLQIRTAAVRAHQIPASVLALDDQGNLGVKVLNGKSVVTFVPVSVVGDAGEQLWVTGLGDAVTLISVGQEYVSVGQKVTGVPEASWVSGAAAP